MSKRIIREDAILNLRQEAQRRVIKDEVMKFRLEAATLERLLRLAQQLNKPAGTLVREWVVEKLDQIETGRTEPPEVTAISIIADSLAERGLLRDEQIDRIRQLLSPEG
ncbi:MAG TPA: hypothetical protein V6D08_15680 [Candidatus Obscuribacterales bacterium]